MIAIALQWITEAIGFAMAVTAVGGMLWLIFVGPFR